MGFTETELFPVEVRTVEELYAEADEMVTAARAKYQPSKVFLLYSGGKDSTVLLDAMHHHADAVVHVNTGTGIPQTAEFVRSTVPTYGLPLLELHPPVSYEEMVLSKSWNGMPGPGFHRYTYINLKQRCIEALIREHRTRRGEPFMLLAGARRDESERRMGNSEDVSKRGGQVWVNPLNSWTNEEMANWRRVKELPLSEVAYNLHMSGECLCGAYAHPGELAEIRFFYPEVAARIDALEAKCRERGMRFCTWGENRPAEKKIDPNQGEMFEPMCSDCATRWAS